jgi:hypothetical protein
MALQMKEITDPNILKRLNAGEYKKSKEITDPDLLKRLNAGEFEKYNTSFKNPSIASDISESIASIPGSLLDFVVNLPGQVTSSASQIVKNPLRAAENLGAGLLEGIKGGINIPSNIASYLRSRNIGGQDAKYLQDLIAKAHIPDTGLEKAVLGENQIGDEFLRSLGSFAPYARAGGLARGLGGAARRAGAASAYATGQEEDPLKAALLGLTAEGATRGIQAAGRKGTFLPSSPLTSEELKQAADVTRGTETNLGNVIQNPFLQKQFENVFPNIPLSGANQAMQRTASEIKNRGENILNKFKGSEDVPDIGERLHAALKSSAEETRNKKNEKFTALNEAADKEGVKTDRFNLINTAKQMLKEIEDDPHLAGLTDSTAKGILDTIANEKIKPNYSLKKTDLLRGKIGKKRNEAYISGNTDLRDILKTLKDAATKDINDAIDKADKPNLTDLRDKAMEFYMKEYAPFKEPEIEKFTIRGGDPDILAANFLKRSKLSDRGNLLQKLTSKLSSHDKDLLAYSYFSNAIKEGELNPSKLNTLYKDLGKKQKNALLSKEMQKQLGDYSKLVQKNTEPLNIMFNPKTGQRNLSDYLISALTGSTGAYAGGLTGGILGAIAPGLIARPFTKALTNPAMRERLIERMIRAREKEPMEQRNIAPLVQGLTQTINQ